MTQDYTHDIKLTKDDEGIWDINFVDGDFEVDDTFDINIIMSLFVDGRADSSEISEPLYRRGFWADFILFPENNFSSGSKFWLISGRNTTQQLNRAIDFVRQSLQWMIEKKYVKTINVDGDIMINGITINIEFIIKDNSISEFNFKLWENGVVEVTTSL